MYYYNIHNIIRVKSNIELSPPLFELNCFKCKDFSERADLIINIVDYKPIDKKRYQQIAAGLYYLKSNDSVVSDMSIFGLNVSWEIRNILSSSAELLVSKSYVFLSRIFYYLPTAIHFNATGLIRSVLQLKLLPMDYSFLVGSCAFLNGKRIVFTGTQTSGKTMSIINFVDVFNADFMSDDIFIINKDRFYCYPSPIRLRRYKYQKMGLFINLSKVLDPLEKFKGKIKDQTKGDCDVYFMEVSSSKSIKEISTAEGINKLCSINNRSISYFSERIISALPYIYGDLSLLDLQKKQFEILSDSLKKARFFIITFPSNKDFMKMIKECYC